MDYALRLEAPDELPADPRQWCAAAWRDTLPPGRLSAVYFGSEFCEDRIPSAAEAASLCALAREADLEAVLLTPVVRPAGLALLGDLLAALGAAGWAPSVVFNDWGVLRLLQHDFSLLPRRGGRLLNRGLRDPRLAHADAAPPVGDSGERSRLLRAFLRQEGASALETDPDLEGGFLGEEGSGLQRTLHLPFAFATTGRHCLGKAAGGARGGAFADGLASPCNAPCRGGPRPEHRPDAPLPLWRAGNTLFYEVPEGLAAAHLRTADRVVLHRRPAP